MTPLGWLGRKTSTQTNKQTILKVITVLFDSLAGAVSERVCGVQTNPLLIQNFFFHRKFLKIWKIWDTVFIRNSHIHYSIAYIFLQQIYLLSMNVCKIAGWVANSVDPDQTPRSAASDLGLHCLLRSVFPNTQSKYGYLIKSTPHPRLRNHPGSAPVWVPFFL